MRMEAPASVRFDSAILCRKDRFRHGLRMLGLLYSDLQVNLAMNTARAVGAMAFLLAASLGYSQKTQPAGGACAGPPALTAQLKTHPTTENAIALGNWFAMHEQFACAAQTFHNGLKSDAGSAQLHYLYALALVTGKRVPEAVPELQQAIRLDPQAVKPHLLMASLYAGAGRQAEAAGEWQKVLAIDPKNESAIDGLSGAMMEHEDYTDAAALLLPAPRTEKFTIRLSQALGLMGFLDQAVDVLHEGLKANPHSVAIPRALAVVLVRQRKHEDAINVLLKAVTEHPTNVDAAEELYMLYVLVDRIKEAATMKDRLLAARPHDRDVLYLSGCIERSQGKYDLAEKHLEESVAIDPEFFFSRYNLGKLDVILQKWPQAKENLEKAISLGTEEPEVHFDLAKTLYALGEKDRANEELQKFQDLKQEAEMVLEARPFEAQGDLAMASGDVDAAITHYREANQMVPKSALYHFKLSSALHKKGDLAGEKAELEEAIRLNPKLSNAQGELGFLLAREGDADGAAEHFRKAVETAPRWTDAWINLAAELAVSAHYAEARQAVAMALQLEPDNERARQLSDQLARDPNARQAQP
jgi:tetratricopeptide (TPR) repeat protein